LHISKSLAFKILIAFVLLCVAASAVLWQQLNSPKFIGDKSTIIAKGSASSSIALRLEKDQIISSASIFRWWTHFSGDAASLKPGLYHVTGEKSMLAIIDMLKKGEIQQFKVTIPEGLRSDEMLSLLALRTSSPLPAWQQAMQDIVGDAPFEGVFLPETYLYSKPINPKAVLQQMYAARAKVEADLAKEMGWNTQQIQRNRIMASIVEKETALAHERVWVAAAIHNRLRLHMPLQMDPTVIYGIYRTKGAFSGNIRRKDLKKDTPWNTYTRQGLPITAICNPGEASLRAAAHPADVNYLYFVADGSGGHAFASTLAEHNANVRQWIRIERKRNQR